MDDYNKRSAEMWDHIKVSTSFKNKQVVDLGCGHGDFIWRAYEEGAKYVLGVDRDTLAISESMKRCRHHGVAETVHFAKIEEFIMEKTSNSFTYYDIAFCFSVLPYLTIDMNRAVELISSLAPISFFEIQYLGDGPGIVLRDDDDAMLFLLQYYNDITKIGETQAKVDHVRSIWRCKEGGRYR